MTPPAIKPKEFEELLLESAKRVPGCHLSRYGVMTIMKDGKWLPVPSLPDLEGVFEGGRQFIIEAKVCSQASFPMEKKTIKPRQVAHMLSRSAAGVPCWVIVHFCERKLKTSSQPGETIALRVHPDDVRWQRFVDAYADARRSGNPVEGQGSISRDEAARIGVKVNWTCPKGSRKFLPDLAGLLGISETALL